MKKTLFNGKIKIIKLSMHYDRRGFFTESYNKKKLKKIGIIDNFVQDNLSFSKTRGVIRGIHFQKPPYAQAKLVQVLKGSIQDIIVDIQKKSDTYGQYISIILHDYEYKQIYIPEGFAHGFCTLKNNTLVNYKTSNFYNNKCGVTLNWNDKTINVDWKISIKKSIISYKDKKGISFNKFISPFY